MSRDVLVGPKGAAVCWVLSGLAFALYPVLRPFSSESGLDGAKAFGSSFWLAAHISAIVAFGLLIFAAAGTAASAPRNPRTARISWTLQVAGVGLLLPFYGAEAYGLHALGQAATRSEPSQVDGLVGLASDVRGGIGLVLFLIGAAALAIGASLGVVTTAPMTLRRWAALIVATALVLLVPQFLADQPLRIAHGVLFLLGATLFAASLMRSAPQVHRDAAIT